MPLGFYPVLDRRQQNRRIFSCPDTRREEERDIPALTRRPTSDPRSSDGRDGLFWRYGGCTDSAMDTSNTRHFIMMRIARNMDAILPDRGTELDKGR
jgi:hypothetical protein